MVARQPQIATVERKIARLAARSHGVVTREELIRADLTQAQIRSRLAAGSLISLHRGVFRVGHTAPSLEARYAAAVKAGGEVSLLCGRAAAHLLGLLKRAPRQPEVLTTRRRSPSGVTTRRCRVIDRSDATIWRGVPVTNAPTDHRGSGRGSEGRWACAVSLSKLESSFIAVLRRARLPLPRTNIPVGAYYVDCRWPEHRLTVELDSYRYHRTRHAWEQDRQPEREARTRGDEFRRYTWVDVVEMPTPMLADLRALLTRPRGASAPPRGIGAS